jgi:histidyl-tRNA synthetase
LFFNLGESESKQAFTLLQLLRNKGIAGELFHEPAKFDKQFKYAEKKSIPYIVILGSEELASGTCIVKDLANSTQQTLSQQDLAEFPFS